MHDHPIVLIATVITTIVFIALILWANGEASTLPAKETDGEATKTE